LQEIEARRLLTLSREAHWAFPSSYGAPSVPGEESVQRLVAERDRLPEAAEALDDEEATELAANAWRAWMVERDVEGGRRFVDAILDRGGTLSRSLALYGSGLLALRGGDRAVSRDTNDEALKAARERGDPEALALACLGLARVALENGDHEAARTLAVEARDHASGLEPAMGQAPLHIHAQVVRQSGDYDGAAGLFEESLALNRRVGDRGMVEVELQNLSLVELHRGNVEAARSLLEELAPPDDDPLGAGALAYARGDADAARSLLAQADRDELPQDDRVELDWLLAELG
jgi:tetratricopeptide (TPR) repeat protein